MKALLNFKLRGFTLLAAVLTAAVFLIAPAQFPVVLHKFSLVTLAAVLGYWLDRHIFPESRPSEVFTDCVTDARAVPLAVGAMYRRAGIVIGTMLAVALAL